MQIDLGSINWLAILACVVVGQVFLTIWFVALFGEPWAKVYGASDKKQHAKELPGYTYAIGAACVLLLSLGLAVLQSGLGIDGVGGGLTLGVVVGVAFCVATALPGYAFLRRWQAAALAIGSQATLILILSVILAVWR